MGHAEFQTLLNSASRPEFSQPVVPSDMKLLRSAYFHDGLWLDLWGFLSDENGYDVQTVSLTGTKIAMDSYGGEMNGAMLRKMSDKLDRDAFANKRNEVEQAAISNYEWHRQMG